MTIHKYLKNTKTRKRGDHKRIFTPNDHKKICESYENGTSTTEISNEYKCTPSSIIKILKKHGIKRRINEGENHPNWKGGISFEPYAVSSMKISKRDVGDTGNVNVEFVV